MVGISLETDQKTIVIFEKIISLESFFKSMSFFQKPIAALKRWLLPGFITLALVLTSQLMMAPALATGIYEMPETAPESHILDQSEILSRITEGQLTTQLDGLLKDKGQDVYIASIRRLDYEETIESFTQQLFTKWFATPEAQANKTLLVIDSLTDNTAIVRGDGAKALMSDAIATSVAQETILVPLKYGNRYNQAFADAGDRMTKVLSGLEDPGPPEVKETVNTESTFATPEETKESNAITWVIVLVIASTVIPMATYYLYVYLGNR
jgi:uncharacterized protein